MAKKVSIVIPFHWMENWPFFLKRCLKSIEEQTFTDYEVILMKVGDMPETSNRVIEAAQGDLIKILYMDDYLAYKDSLQEIVDSIGDKEWLVTGCVHDVGDGTYFNEHHPRPTDDISTGNNCIGSPSVLTMKREAALLFDTYLSWLLDCDLYQRLHDAYGPPAINNNPLTVIGLHKGQATHLLSDERKQAEFTYLKKKHGN